MGQSLDFRVVTEGVETEEQETFLRAIGCCHVQGYRYGRPALIEDLCAQLGSGPQRRRA
jgi:EAL domain-containing protein (putative c-di-GMP-specific phosphodiesterase class I)